MAYIGSREIHLWDYWLILRKRKAVLVVTVLSFLGVALLVNFLQRPVYESSTELVVESNFPKYLPGKEVLQPIETFDTVYFYTQFKIIKGQAMLEKVARRLESDLQRLPEYITKLSAEDRHQYLINFLRSSIRTSTMPKTNIFYITVEGRDPKFVTLVADTVARVYIEEHRRSQRLASQESLVFLTNKLEELKERLKASEIALQGFPVIQGIKDQIYGIEVKLKDLRKVYGENHPAIIELKVKRQLLEKKLAEEIRRESARLKPLSKQMIALKDEEKEGEGTRENVSLESDSFINEQVRYLMMQREALINEEMYQILLKKLREADVSSSIEPISVRIIEQARVPSRPIRPKKKLNLIFSLLLGITIGTGLAFFREYLDTSLKTAEEIEKILGLSVLGVIPSIISEEEKGHLLGSEKGFFKRLKSALGEKGKSISFLPHRDIKPDRIKRISIKEDLKSPISEAYRSLRTNIHFASLNRPHPCQTLMLSSPARGEGKTTTTINLGVVFAQTGKRVLLVDSDLRRPCIHYTFGRHREKGLTTLLVSAVNPEEVILPTDVENLYLLPSGPLPPNPSELLGSQKMKELIQILRGRFDLVLFDSPPLVAVTDAAVLASSDIDGIIIVIQAGKTPREVARQGLASLTTVKDKTLGAILNNINVERGSYYYYYYHYDYSYGYKDKEEELRTTDLHG